jgi:hypothetical protein
MTEVPQETAEVLLEKAKRLTRQAQRKLLLDPEDYPGAIEDQREAVRLVQGALGGLEADSSASADERKECAHRLADYWGRLGGIYRRADMVPEGIEAYGHGKEIEGRYQLDDSYNRINWIVLTLLQDPGKLGALEKEINEAIDLIQAQVQGPRRDQWWAWADLGLVCQLGGRPRESGVAYEHFRQAGARPTDYKSVLPVLEQLRATFEPSDLDLATRLGETIRTLEAEEGGA